MMRKPYPRFWYAGNLQRAAEQGMNGLGRATREMIEQYWQIWDAGRERKDPRFLGDDPLVGSTRHIVIAETDKEALALARRAFVAYAEHFYCTDPRLGPGSPPGLPARSLFLPWAYLCARNQPRRGKHSSSGLPFRDRKLYAGSRSMPLQELCLAAAAAS